MKNRPGSRHDGYPYNENDGIHNVSDISLGDFDYPKPCPKGEAVLCSFSDFLNGGLIEIRKIWSESIGPTSIEFQFWTPSSVLSETSRNATLNLISMEIMSMSNGQRLNLSNLMELWMSTQSIPWFHSRHFQSVCVAMVIWILNFRTIDPNSVDLIRRERWDCYSFTEHASTHLISGFLTGNCWASTKDLERLLVSTILNHGKFISFNEVNSPRHLPFLNRFLPSASTFRYLENRIQPHAPEILCKVSSPKKRFIELRMIIVRGSSNYLLASTNAKPTSLIPQ